MEYRSNVTDMTSGPSTSLILRFALPLMAGNLLQQFYAVVDTIVVGQGVGISALASLGAADWLGWLMLWMVQGLTQGFAVLIAQQFGTGNRRDLRRAVTMSALLSLAIGAVFTVAGLAAANPLLRLLGTPENIIGGSWAYLRIIFSGTLVVTAYNMASCLLRSLGDSRTPLVAMAIAAVINISLDLLFVLVFGWGITGAAVATVIAQGISFIYCLRGICHIPLLCLEREDWRIDRKIIGKLLRLGVPMAFSQGIIATGGMVVQFVVNSYGFLFVAGFTATNKLYGVLESAAISFGFAMTTYMGQNYGACKLDRIRLGMRKMLVVTVVTAAAISFVMILFGKNLVGLFISGDPAEAAQVLDIAYRYLLIMSSMLIVLYLLNIYRASLQGLGNATMPAVSGIIEFAMRIAVALFLPRLVGEGGIFFAEIAAWTGAAVYLMLGYYYHVGKIERTWKAGGQVELAPS